MFLLEYHQKSSPLSSKLALLGYHRTYSPPPTSKPTLTRLTDAACTVWPTKALFQNYTPKPVTSSARAPQQYCAYLDFPQEIRDRITRELLPDCELTIHRNFQKVYCKCHYNLFVPPPGLKRLIADTPRGTLGDHRAAYRLGARDADHPGSIHSLSALFETCYTTRLDVASALYWRHYTMRCWAEQLDLFLQKLLMTRGSRMSIRALVVPNLTRLDLEEDDMTSTNLKRLRLFRYYAPSLREITIDMTSESLVDLLLLLVQEGRRFCTDSFGDLKGYQLLCIRVSGERNERKNTLLHAGLERTFG